MNPHTEQPTATATACQARPTSSRTNQADDVRTAVDIAHDAVEEAGQAWGADPGSTELLDAYVQARRTLHEARRQAIAATEAAAPRPWVASTGPTVLTPVIEWWTTQ